MRSLTTAATTSDGQFSATVIVHTIVIDAFFATAAVATFRTAAAIQSDIDGTGATTICSSNALYSITTESPTTIGSSVAVPIARGIPRRISR